MTSSDEALSWKYKLVVIAGTLLLRLLGATWRVKVVNQATIDGMRARREPVFFSLWHGHLLPLLWLHRGEGVIIVISEHKDGEIVARIAQNLGYGLIRGSTTRGGTRALIQLTRALQEGRDVAITPDGPRGPAETVAPGTIAAAQRSGVPVLPTLAHCDRAWRLRSWDRFMIPKPFARLSVAYGAPMKFADTESNSERSSQALIDAMRAAQKLAGE